jgi:hypothetical protein
MAIKVCFPSSKAVPHYVKHFYVQYLEHLYDLVEEIPPQFENDWYGFQPKKNENRKIRVWKKYIDKIQDINRQQKKH